MTQTLDAAIAKLATLPPDEQDRVGRWLLDELRDEERWARQFATSQDVLSTLGRKREPISRPAERHHSTPRSCDVAHDAALLGGVP